MKEAANYHITSIVTKITLWVGIFITLSSVVYAIFNLSNIDNFITIWSILMAVGVFFSFIGIFANIVLKLSQKKKTSFTN